MTLTFSVPFGYPFHEGGASSTDVPYKFPVAIDGHAYLVDVEKYRRRTLPALRPPSDNQIEPGEQSLNTEGFWRRTQQDWSLGAGQEFFDLEDSTRRRFYTSKGVNPWTRNRLTLLSDTALRQASANTNLKVLAVNGYFYFVDGATLKHTTTPTSPSWTSVTLTGVSSAITDIATDGSKVFVADGTQVFSSTVGSSTSSVLTATDADYVQYANGRLIATDANILFEISAAGTATTCMTHANTSFVWNSIVSAPNGIYAAGNSGDHNEIYYVGITTAVAALSVPIHVMSLPDGETLNSMAYYGGLLLLGTSTGLRLAIINDDNTLSHGPVIEITNGVAAFEPQGQYVWFSWKNYDGTSTGLGRANLAEATSSLVPAYASDLMAAAQGTVQSVASFGGYRYFTVSGVGLYGEATTKVASGTLNSGSVQFGTVERKVVSSLDMRFDPLAGSIDVTVTGENGTSNSTAQVATAGSTSAGPLSLGTFNAESFTVTLTLIRDAGATTTGPTIRRWTARAIATPFRTEEFIVPLILRSTVDNPIGEGQDEFFDPGAEFSTLKTLEAERSVITYQEGANSYTVYIDGIEVQPDKWMDDRSFFQGLIVVRMLTVESAE